ncbi:MAG: hypothetical protein V1492_02015 [Candidatus Micrarchaeota archaeon]
MNLVFNEDSLNWLRQKGFSDSDIEDSQRCISIAAKSAKNGELTFRLPVDTTLKVAALAYAVVLTMDEETITGTLVSMSEEARDAFNEEMEIGELEQVTAKIGKIKLGRRYSDARTKTSIKKDRTSFE